MENTTIWIKKQTKELLDRTGRKGETYDDIIKRIVLKYNSKIPLDIFGRLLYRQGVEGLPYFMLLPYPIILQMLDPKSSVVCWDGKKNYSYWDQNITTDKAKEIIYQHLQKGNHLQELILRWWELVDKQKLIEKEIQALRGQSDSGLISLLRKFTLAARKTWEIGLFIELFDPDSESIILEILNKYDQNHLSLKEFKVLCSPLELSNIQKEMLSLYQIALSRDLIKLKEHAERFYWIENTWAEVKVLDFPYFKNKVARLEDERIDFKAEIEKIRAATAKLDFDKKEILKEKKLSQKVQRVIEFFELMTNWREQRKKYALISNHFMGIILDEIAKRSKVSKRLLMFSSPLEINLPLTDKFVEELGKRSDYCLLYMDHGKEVFVFGETARNYIHQIESTIEKGFNQLYGNTANPGKVEGIARIIFTTDDLHKMQKDDILVVPCTRPEYVPAMKKAKAILTDEGGITSHAAIVSRELGIPCLVGLRNATDVIKDGDKIFVNANHGVVLIKDRKR